MIMGFRHMLAALVAATTLSAFATTPSCADVKDYEFQLVQNEAKKGEAIIAVRLFNKKSGKTVPDAVISAKRIDMAPDGMAGMAPRIDQMPSTEPGVYRFKTNLSMEGRRTMPLNSALAATHHYRAPANAVAPSAPLCRW
jgi:YtkA-like